MRSGDENVLAIVVTFNPEAGLGGRLAALRAQVRHLLVVDNGSKNADNVRSAAFDADCETIFNPHNVGIAEALNQGAREALARGSDWLATFDQDSVVPIGAIAHLLMQHDALPPATRVAVMAMSHRDANTGLGYQRPGNIIEDGVSTRRVKEAITSGSLIRTPIFDEVGFFDASFFIDSVDLDFCLRCRAERYQIIESCDVILGHTLGDSTMRSLFGWKFVLTRHAPFRRYYITRNQLEVCRRHFAFDPVWAWNVLWTLVRSNSAALLFESGRAAKVAAISAGVRDFLFRRFGPYR